MQPQLARAALEQHARRLHRQRRHRVRLAARRVERARAGEARHADLPLDLGVVRLELGVADRPVRKGGAGDRADAAAFVEVDLVQAPVVRGEVRGAAADVGRVPGGREVLRRASRPPLADWRNVCGLRLEVVAELQVDPVGQFVVPEVGRRCSAGPARARPRRARRATTRARSVPPAAPEPMTTKSTVSLGLNLRALMTALLRQTAWARVGHESSVSGVVVTEGRLPGVLVDEAHQLPAEPVRVAAVGGQRQQAR